MARRSHDLEEVRRARHYGRMASRDRSNFLPISFSFRLEYNSKERGKGKAMSEWTDNLAEQRRKKAEDQRVQTERNNIEAAILDQGFSYLWSELKRVLPEKCREINSAKSIGIQLNHIDKDGELSIVRQDNGATVKIVRDQRIRSVDISGAEAITGIHTQHIRVKVNGNQFYFADSESGQNVKVSKILESAIEFLLSV